MQTDSAFYPLMSWGVQVAAERKKKPNQTCREQQSALTFLSDDPGDAAAEK